MADDFTTTYRPHRDPAVQVEAVQLTEDADWDTVAVWSGGSLANHEIGDSGEYATTLRISGEGTASEGDWIVRYPSGMVLIWMPDEFACLYSLTTGSSPSEADRG